MAKIAFLKVVFIPCSKTEINPTQNGQKGLLVDGNTHLLSLAYKRQKI